MTHEKLQSITDAELRSIAYSHGIYEEGSEFDRETLIDELVEDLELLSAQNSSVHVSRKRYEFTAEVSYLYEDPDVTPQDFVFLKRYGQTKLITIQRDTTWIFVDWEIAPNVIKSLRQLGNYNGIFLRTTCYIRDHHGKFYIEDFQDSSLDNEQGRQYFQLIQTSGDYWHQLSIRVESGGKEHHIVSSEMLMTSKGVVR